MLLVSANRTLHIGSVVILDELIIGIPCFSENTLLKYLLHIVRYCQSLSHILTTLKTYVYNDGF